jgi:hypothetical protein
MSSNRGMIPLLGAKNAAYGGHNLISSPSAL